MLVETIETSRLQQLMILTLACALVTAGVAGGQWFMDCDYVHFGYMDKTDWTVSAGYTAAQFWALVLQTVCLPAAAIAFITFASHSFKSTKWPAWLKATFYFGLLVVFSICATVADDTMTDGLVDCLWSFCEEGSTSTADAFTAFIPAMGTVYFCVLVIFATMATLLLVRTAADAFGCTKKKAAGGLSKEEAQPLIPAVDHALMEEWPSRQSSGTGFTSPSSSMEKQRRKTEKMVSYLWFVGVFIVFFPFFIYISMAVNNAWLGMTITSMQSYLSSSVTQIYGTVWNIPLSSSVILKLYPDVLIYWSFVYVISIIGLLGRFWSPLRVIFHSPAIIGSGRGWKNGEVLLSLMFVALLIMEGLYWYIDHGWDSTEVSELTWANRLARTMGQLANITMGLMILPVSRNGVVEKVFGVSWEAMMAYHRRMARVFLGAVLLHMVLMWEVFAENGTFWHDWPIAIPTTYHSDNFTIPLAVVTTASMVVIMFGLSVTWMRRNHFEVFYYSHHFFMVIWGVMLWHATSAWYYIIASITLWIVDRAIRFSKGLAHVTVTDMTFFESATKVSYTVESAGIGPWGGKSKALLHQAGQYAFINVPAISLLEWHPFTIASCPDDAETTHYIKDMGPETFTGHLRMLVNLGKQPKINVDGPYGLPVEYERYNLLVLIAGGIGITPCISLARHLVVLSRTGHLPQGCLEEGVKLIWVTRSIEEIVMLENELRDIAGNDWNADGKFTVQVHLTNVKTSSAAASARTSIPLTEGRPDLPSYLASFGRGDPALFSSATSRKPALVFACGPPRLVQNASLSARDAGVDFHAETFEL